MSVVIRAVGFASGEPCEHRGWYLMSFDFDAWEGLGEGEFTPDIEEAKQFKDFAQAIKFWQTQSKVNPIRRDGRPNRPLTCLSITVVEYY